ncbi:DUF1206 domain-containing protein [Cellulomonas sp. zg-ZUI222]|uniref:DUF1206 domain-containing protein n=1 Tax=Cellulomonas wangleii TaxID=2816956 RepID=A0ABX8D0P0_9CELL|nr:MULTISPECIES: DUF1206 domain-containing protein [Cellulomonas]MBO0900037.1 DUF1206 domain-containing protein [Cellulomonas sp. zg-ZUI22]MBO0921048.1 DUF1206 domain-containing protein [Cellulomonas wangleii]MBO0925470.1 DUF1206 domain-containing protein [Cellulomonas wangleii]QVI61058.1 DUF1206 domain-containing protein [Cellulomonas wangleii]
MTTVATGSRQGAWELGARAGYAASGLVHVLIGVLAVQLAFGSSAGSADQSGAFEKIASSPFGAVVLWFTCVAFLALGAWYAAAAISGAAGGTSERAKAGGKAAVYVALGVTAFAFARGSGSGSGSQTSSVTGELMQAPGGRLLVGAVGVGIVAVGAYHVHKGLTKKFLEDLRRLPAGTTGRVARQAGVVGYTAKGVALGIVGVLFVVAAADANPQEATGLDGALVALRDAPGGPVLLLLVAVGLIAFGAYCGIRARFGRL